MNDLKIIKFIQRSFQPIKSGAGFTLLEGIIALGVISTGLMVGLTLALSNLLASQDNERRAIGANLAREGIEVVRNIRDSNWLKRDLNTIHNGDAYAPNLYNWDDLTDKDGALIGRAFFVQAVPGSTITYRLVNAPLTIDNIEDCTIGSVTDCRVKFDSSTGIYGGTLGSNTLFNRLITIQDICWNDNGNLESTAAPGVGCDVNYVKVGMLVISSVRYVSSPNTVNKINHDIVAKERLYNWR